MGVSLRENGQVFEWHFLQVLPFLRVATAILKSSFLLLKSASKFTRLVPVVQYEIVY
jgi:hypothetical protein